MRRALRAAMLAAAILTARRAVAQDSAAVAGLDQQTSGQVARILESARSRGLPIDPILSKVRFAVVVHAPPSKIVATAQAVATRLEAARAIVAPHGASGDIAAGEEALSFDVPRDVLRKVVQASPNHSVAVPIGVLTQLVVRGVPVERASMQIVDLLQRGAVARNFIALEESVRQDVLAGRRPDESLDLRLKGIIPNLPQSATADGAGLQAATPKKPR